MKLSGFKYFTSNILSYLGFDSLADFLTTIIGIKNNLLTFFAFIFGAGISLFIKEHVWSEPAQVYFLFTLTAIDLFTGVWKSIKNRHVSEKRFRSRRIVRTAGKIVTYSIILYVSFNLNKHMPAVFFWMPYSCLGVFYATETWSIVENLSEIGYLNSELVNFLKEKLNIMNYLKRKSNGKKDNSYS